MRALIIPAGLLLMTGCQTTVTGPVQESSEALEGVTLEQTSGELTIGFPKGEPHEWGKHEIEAGLQSEAARFGLEAVVVEPEAAAVWLWGVEMPQYKFTGDQFGSTSFPEPNPGVVRETKDGRTVIMINQNFPWHAMKDELRRFVAESLNLSRSEAMTLASTFPAPEPVEMVADAGSSYSGGDVSYATYDMDLAPLPESAPVDGMGFNPLFPTP